MNKGVILAIDDSAESLKLLSQILGREGYTVRVADSGEAGLASAVTNPPDLILLDIRLSGPAGRDAAQRREDATARLRLANTAIARQVPQLLEKGRVKSSEILDGFVVCRQLKAMPETSGIPVIFLSGTTDNDERVEALRMGAVDFVSKPFRPDDLLARVQTHIEMAHVRTSLQKDVTERTMHLRLTSESVDIPLQEAVTARDWPLVIRLFEPTALLMFGQQVAIRNWLMQLPQEAIQAEPGLAFWRTYALLGSGRLVAGEKCAIAADALAAKSGKILEQARLRSIWSRIAGWRGDTKTSLELAHQGLEMAQGGTPFQTAVGHHWLGLAYTMVGNPCAAAEQFLAVCADCERMEGSQRWLASVGFYWYGRALYMQGRLNDAIAVCRRAVAIEREHGGPAARATFGLETDILTERHRLSSAQQALAKAIDLDGPFEQWFAIPITWLCAARLYYAQDDAAAGDVVVDNLVEWAQRNGCDGIKDSAESLRVTYWLSIGQIERSWLWAVERNVDLDAPFTYQDEPKLLAVARVYLHQARSTGDEELARKAGAALGRVRAAAEADSRMGDALTASLAEAIALDVVGDVDGALARLERGLAFGAAEGFHRTFMNEGEPMLALLRRAMERGICPDETRMLIGLFAYKDPMASILAPTDVFDPRSNEMINPLTERELELLRLIAAGLTNADISETLFITHNTVKTHIKHLFQKLGVSSRTEAVAKARSVGLLF